MEPHAFEQLVETALDGLPDDFAELLERGNVEVEVELVPSQELLKERGIGPGSTLLGLYRGSPMTGRGWGYNLVLPDSITIFQEPIEVYCRQLGQPVPDVVRMVVIHEIAHHFGISDDRLRELGY